MAGLSKRVVQQRLMMTAPLPEIGDRVAMRDYPVRGTVLEVEPVFTVELDDGYHMESWSGEWRMEDGNGRRYA